MATSNPHQPTTAMHNYLDIILQNRISSLNNQALEFTKKFDSRIYELQHELHRFSLEKIRYHQALAANQRKIQERVTKLPRITMDSEKYHGVITNDEIYRKSRSSNVPAHLCMNYATTRQRQQMLHATGRELRRLRRASVKYQGISAEELANQRRRKLNNYHSNCNADRREILFTPQITPNNNKRSETVVLESVKTANAMLRTPFVKQKKPKKQQ